METDRAIERTELVTDEDGMTLISWGAVFAGLVLIVAMSWLLYLLGIAIGVSVADMSDMTTIGSGFGISAMIWMIISSLVVFFLGAMLTARLTGKHDSTTGMLHGVTLWGVATSLMLVLSYVGITGLMQTGQAFLSSTASTLTNAASVIGTSTTKTANYVAQNASAAADSKIVNTIQARLKRHAAKIIVDSEAVAGTDISQSEVRETIDQLDSDVLQNITAQMIDGDTEQAKETLANNSELSEQQIDDLVEGISNEIQETLGTDKNNSGLATDIQNRVKQQFATFVSGLDAPGGPGVSSQHVRRAVEQIDAQTLQSIAVQMMRGDVESAKDILTANTNLSDPQVNDLVKGVDREVEQTINKYKEELDAASEAAVTYSQAVLWAVFAASAIGLILSILGGAIGSATSKRLYLAHHREVIVE